MGSPAFEPQHVLAGRYRLEERLGAGGMGAIWRAEHLLLQAPVAVKLIDRDAVRDEQTVARFLREAKAAAALRSPHVVQILDYGMDEGVPFIVMELLEGETLAQRLKRLKRMTPADVARIVSHVARAVGRAHEAGIIHRDLKPENVFIVHNDDEEVAKVLDFGVAKVEHGQLATEGEKTRTGSILGTPYYMSPEQAQGNKAVDARSDLWSLAVIAFECLTGTRPFYSDGLGDLVLQICVRELPVPSEVASVPIGFDDWFKRGIARDPDERFQSARELSDALREAFGLEARDASLGGTPHIVVSSRPESLETGRGDPNSSRFASSSVNERGARQTPTGNVRASGEADPTAATLAYTPTQVEASLRLSREVSPPDTSTGSGLGAVVAVAGVALALGLGGGVYLIQNYGLSSLIPGLGKGRDEAPTATRASRVSRTASVTAPSSALSARAPAPSASVLPRAQHAPSAPPRERPQLPSPIDAGAAAASTADAGWEKPDWAKPDPEPERANDIEDLPSR